MPLTNNVYRGPTLYEVADQFVQGDFPHLIEDVCHKILKVFHIQFL